MLRVAYNPPNACCPSLHRKAYSSHLTRKVYSHGRHVCSRLKRTTPLETTVRSDPAFEPKRPARTREIRSGWLPFSKNKRKEKDQWKSSSGKERRDRGGQRPVKVQREASDGTLTVEIDFGKLRDAAVQTVHNLMDVRPEDALRAARRGGENLASGLADWRTRLLSTSISAQSLPQRLSFRIHPSSVRPLIFLFLLALLLLFRRLVFSLFCMLGFTWAEDDLAPRQQGKVIRDRSLGGKEVVASYGTRTWWAGLTGRNRSQPSSEAQKRKKRGTIVSPLDMPEEESLSERFKSEQLKQRVGWNGGYNNGGVSLLPGPPKELPDWWRKSQAGGPVVRAAMLSRGGMDSAEDEMKRILEGMINSRNIGLDFSDQDILQLHSSWQRSGVSVSLETENVRDALYRAAIALAFNAASGRLSLNASLPASRVPSFLVAVAAAIQVPPRRAVTMVHAALAARTRSTFLQAWALLKQNKREEAEVELASLAAVADVVTPPTDSPEIEMVSAGLSQRISRPERNELLWMFNRAGGAGTKDVMALALGLPTQ